MRGVSRSLTRQPAHTKCHVQSRLLLIYLFSPLVPSPYYSTGIPVLSLRYQTLVLGREGGSAGGGMIRGFALHLSLVHHQLLVTTLFCDTSRVRGHAYVSGRAEHKLGKYGMRLPQLGCALCRKEP